MDWGLAPDAGAAMADIPNIPYAWDRELKWLLDSRLDDDQLNRILNKNAAEFFHLDV